MRRFWIFTLMITAIGCGAGESQAAKSAKPSARPVAADFTLSDLEGNPVRLSSLKGKVVLLDFWATWCPPCREEIPHFRDLYAAYRPNGLEVVGISLDQGGQEVVRPFVKEYQVNYPIVMGDSRVVQAYGGIRGIPTTFLIDKKGQIARRYVGYHSKETFEQQIQLLLSE